MSEQQWCLWQNGMGGEDLIRHSKGGTNCRPVVVVDAEDREQVERFTHLFLSHYWSSEYATHTDAGQAALREFANPTPPEPDEPTALGAVVEASWRDSEGKGFGPAHWARGGDGSWICLTDGHTRTGTAWPFLVNVRVLSEGVQS